jgi:hypothetical protein
MSDTMNDDVYDEISNIIHDVYLDERIDDDYIDYIKENLNDKDLAVISYIVSTIATDSQHKSEMSEFHMNPEEYQDYAQTALTLYYCYGDKIDFMTRNGIENKFYEETDVTSEDLASSFSSVVDSYKLWQKLKEHKCFHLDFDNHNNHSRRLVNFTLDFCSDIRPVDNKYTIHSILEKQHKDLHTTSDFDDMMKKEIYDTITEFVDYNTLPSSAMIKKHFKNLLKKLVDEEFINKSYPEIYYKLREIKNQFKSSEMVLNKYFRYNNLIKKYGVLPKDHNYNFNILTETDFEKMNDFMDKVIDLSNTKKYAKTFMGSYAKLMNDESFDIFKAIKEKNMPKDFIKNELRKIASFKNTETLNNTLEKILNSDGLTQFHILDKIEKENLNVTIIKNTSTNLVFKVNDYNASKRLGSNQWCISTSNSYYDQYLKYKPEQNTHVFAYDFSLKEQDPLSYISFTYNDESGVIHAFNKKDTKITSSEKLKQLISDEIRKSIDDIFFKNRIEKEKSKKNNIKKFK